EDLLSQGVRPLRQYVRRVVERIEEQLLARQAARDELAAYRLDHGWRSAGIDVDAAEVRVILQRDFVNPAAAALPVVLWRRLGEHRGVPQVRVLQTQLEDLLVFVQILACLG